MSKAQPKLSRRVVFAGVGTVGALAAVAAMLPKAQPVPAKGAAAPKADAEQGGYQETAHVLQYYQTARI
jgi:cysteine synthase